MLDSKLIAKNTILLYFRMIFVMCIKFYTSRIILQILGVSDYGVYNVVGGVVMMLSFISSSLGGASSRFITYDIGKKDIKRLRTTFRAIITIHYILAVFVLLFCETIGLWFVLNKLNIPADRETASIWVYQFSVMASIIAIIGSPYNSLVIAYEKMNMFAYFSIADTVCQLVLVFLISIINYDKLILYSFFVFLVQVCIRYLYISYCHRNFQESRNTKFKWDKTISLQILSYSGWTLNGNLAVVGYTQGINILLNIFFGTAVNAARGIAVQIQTAVLQFCSSFQTAVNPQIVKTYAQGDMINMHALIVRSSKLSFFLILLITTPVFLETQTILNLWLVNVPSHTIAFVKILVVISLEQTLVNPIIMSVHATGKIRNFQIVEGSLLLTIVPLSYFLLKYNGISPEDVFVVYLIIELLTFIVRLKIVLPLIDFSIKRYIKNVILPILLVCMTSCILPTLYNYWCRGNITSLILCTFINMISVLLFSYLFGINKQEKKYVLSVLNNKIKRNYE